MGNAPSREEVDELRDDMISTFDSQRILLLGRYGAGKSSMINTFNHVTNLVQHDSVASIAELGSCAVDTRSHLYTVYSTKIDDMYRSLKESKIKELQRLFTKAPEFINAPGIPPSLDGKPEMTEFYKRALEGGVATDFNLHKYFLSVLEKRYGQNKNDQKTMSIEPASEAVKPWAVVAVLAASSTYAENTTQLAFLIDLKNAKDSLNQGTRIFVVFTHSDASGLSESEKQELKERAADVLKCGHGHIFFFDNYTLEDYYNTKRDLAKEKAVITAFSQILAS